MAELYDVLLWIGFCLLLGSFFPTLSTSKIQDCATESDERSVYLSKVKFVKNFGIDPYTLKRLYVYSKPGRISTVPERVARLVTQAYMDGEGRGTKIREFVLGREPLRPGESIYVVHALMHGVYEQIVLITNTQTGLFPFISGEQVLSIQ